jgi:hypothetical protein
MMKITGKNVKMPTDGKPRRLTDKGTYEGITLTIFEGRGSLINFSPADGDDYFTKRDVKRIKKIARAIGIKCSGLKPEKSFWGGHISVVPGINDLFESDYSEDGEEPKSKTLIYRNILNIIKKLQKEKEMKMADVALIMIESMDNTEGPIGKARVFDRTTKKSKSQQLLFGYI